MYSHGAQEVVFKFLNVYWLNLHLLVVGAGGERWRGVKVSWSAGVGARGTGAPPGANCPPPRWPETPQHSC